MRLSMAQVLIIVPGQQMRLKTILILGSTYRAGDSSEGYLGSQVRATNMIIPDSMLDVVIHC